MFTVYCPLKHEVNNSKSTQQMNKLLRNQVLFLLFRQQIHQIPLRWYRYYYQKQHIMAHNINIIIRQLLELNFSQFENVIQLVFNLLVPVSLWDNPLNAEFTGPNFIIRQLHYQILKQLSIKQSYIKNVCIFYVVQKQLHQTLSKQMVFAYITLNISLLQSHQIHLNHIATHSQITTTIGQQNWSPTLPTDLIIKFQVELQF
eukprot:TRINITY_DN2038_c0_g2_i1.p1 TRINITY_DN2038_c0_g2~~TRINITY_DN2038_c0_g2_i1.p1  ORF type:complete len:202 (-),score=-22.97 TRINITY_DN2038_c0_g2_i1:56-661(-)